jgi:DNA invertase Pin-like site-specific DNA recombinase
MKYGYVRVSTDDQKANLQIAALEKPDCDYIFMDTASRAKSRSGAWTQAFGV